MKHLSIICLLLLFSVSAFAQKIITITGTVTDENKEPLIGVNVTVKNEAGLGSTSDIDGNYSIKVKEYSILVFSYLGFETKEVQLKGQKKVDVIMDMATSNSLNEVVITATGAQEKVTVTGAISNVDVNVLKTASPVNISNSLAGNVAGVMAMQTSGQPGKNTSEFWIRGISTFGANSSALVLVDGFERDLDEVNIEDVESFSVLKDASTTAIYGPRGANGVVLITTKHGLPGKINVNAKFETAYNTRTMTPEFADGITYAKMMNEACITRNQEPVYQPDELEILRLGLDPDLYPNVDWKDVLLKDGAMTYHASVNLSGGGSTARYYVSLGYINEEGMYKTDKAIRKDYNTNANNQRYTYRLNTDIDITKTTLLKVGVSGSLKKRIAPGQGENVWSSLMHQNAISIPLMYSNGYVPAFAVETERSNPWVMATQTGYFERWENKIQTNISLEQNLNFITPGLRFNARFGYDTNNNNEISRKKMPETWRAERFRDANGEIRYERKKAEEKMKQTSSASGNRYEFFEAEFHYNRTFNGHNVGGTLKYTQDSKVSTVGLGEDIKNGIARRHMGVAGRAYYNWKRRYFIDFNFGYNGSENFADGRRFGFFPAFSTAWNIAEEPWVKKHLKFINMFKIRYSYGKVGNDRMNERFPYLYTISGADQPGYEWGDYAYNNSYGGRVYSALASDNVTWEIATKHDVGIDISLFDDKFSATVDYFNDRRDGIFMQRSYLPGMVGITSNPRANVGSVESKGMDGNFAYRQQINKVFLTVRGNFTFSNNTILEKDEGREIYPYKYEKGYRVGQQKGLIAMGLFKDYDDIRNSPKQSFNGWKPQPGDIKYKDVNGDGVINDGDVVAVGSTARPNLIYGMGISAQWKGFDINVHFQGAGKSSFFINGPTVYAFKEKQWGNVLKEVADSDRWIEAGISGDPATENPNAKYPRLTFGGNPNNERASTFWLRDGSYLRLKTLDIGYTLPKKLVRNIKLNKVRIYFLGTNLLTWSKFKLWDPELHSSTGTEYPLARTYSLGLSIGF